MRRGYGLRRDLGYLPSRTPRWKNVRMCRGGICMTTTTGVFLPDEQEQQITKKPPQSVRPSGHESAVSESTAPDDAELQKLNEEQLKAAIVSAWKKLERIGKKDMGAQFYWLREKLRAQGSR